VTALVYDRVCEPRGYSWRIWNFPENHATIVRNV
jgi:hypothetical protein